MAETKGLNTKEGSSSLKSQDPDDEAPDSAMEESASGATETGKGYAAISGRVSCKVPGCDASLEEQREFNQRHRLCDVHQRALEVEMPSGKKRFCQQCNRLHPLDSFDGDKRGCRVRLERHNRRRRVRKQMAKQGGDGGPDDVDDEKNFKGSTGGEGGSAKKMRPGNASGTSPITKAAGRAGGSKSGPAVPGHETWETASAHHASQQMEEYVEMCRRAAMRAQQEGGKTPPAAEQPSFAQAIAASAMANAMGPFAYGGRPGLPPHPASMASRPRGDPYLDHLAAAGPGSMAEYMQNAWKAADLHRMYDATMGREGMPPFPPRVHSEANPEELLRSMAAASGYGPAPEGPSPTSGGPQLTPADMPPALREQLMAWMRSMRS